MNPADLYLRIALWVANRYASSPKAFRIERAAYARYMAV